jgi:hypothetical protein
LPILLEYRFSFEAFSEIAKILEEKCGGLIVQRDDGFEQRYWDIDIAGHRLTLHRDTFAGTSLYAEDLSAVSVLSTLHDRLAEIETPLTVGPSASSSRGAI